LASASRWRCNASCGAEEAWIGDTHTKVGRLGAAHNLYTSLPRALAAYLTLCNGRLSAAECYAQGICNKVVPRDKVIEAAEQLAEMICASSPLAVQAAVRLYRLTAAFPPSLVSYARDLDQQVAESEDGAEGPRAFRERRKPQWKVR
jgi:enoyl-CoA hydratase/carnithine racemase